MSQRVVELWCKLPVELSRVFDRFRGAFPVGDFLHDAENVWEWFDGRTLDGKIGFNISRPWEDEGIPDEPVRFSLAVDDPQLSIEHIGERLAQAMQTAVHTGIVEYHENDQFQWTSHRTFQPKD